jgi:hypothetical protein
LVFGGEGFVEGFGGLVELDDFEELGADAAGCGLLRLLGFGAVGLELEEVLAVLGFFARERLEVQADVDGEAAPAGFGDFEGGGFAG